MKKLLQLALIVSAAFLLTGCNLSFDKENEVISLEPITDEIVEDPLSEEEEDLITESDTSKEPTSQAEEDCFVMGDGKCYQVGEAVDEVGCIVTEKGECQSLDSSRSTYVYNGPNYIRLITHDVKDQDVNKAPVIFQGAVSPNTEKIVVKWGAGKGGYNDIYTLKDFKKGDREFTYRANFGWNNLDYGYNDYTFVAHYEDGSEEQVQTTINFKDSDPRNNPVFDGCKKHITEYASYSWFPALSQKMLSSRGIGMYDKIGYQSQSDACYSENGKMVIFMINGEYMNRGKLFKYYTDTNELFEASLTNNPSGPDTWMEFGKRNGSIIPLYGYFGDAGYMGEYYYNYNFQNNTVTYIKSRSGTVDGGGYGDWVYAN